MNDAEIKRWPVGGHMAKDHALASRPIELAAALDLQQPEILHSGGGASATIAAFLYLGTFPGKMPRDRMENRQIPIKPSYLGMFCEKMP